MKDADRRISRIENLINSYKGKHIMFAEHNISEQIAEHNKEHSDKIDVNRVKEWEYLETDLYGKMYLSPNFDVDKYLAKITTP